MAGGKRGSTAGGGTVAAGVRPDDETARAQALEAATRLYYLRGVQAVGMDALRAESGLSLKRLYQLFPSKEAIVERVLQQQHERWVEGLTSATAAASTPRARLLALYDFLDSWFSDDGFRGCVFINSFGELAGTWPRVAEIVRAHKADFQKFVAELVVDAGGPETLAHQLSILAEGATTTAAIAGTKDAAGHARDAAETLIDAALRNGR
ncbi:TetR/AcrR family transcriptional regulator [Streptomyces sp. ACA25]|uniref:TetR/AcrR family transcriptional regulator n=1 Tax=Streptomyces sp. ACA25 TaxID=3022596 RepID=UPI002307CE07|nr:TetR/AcrR family transcriptional regulator [Streptomyces sp. ACA25]MDB1087382.1 TetR/AcrR family transcriptional regulator [Streptomyces sp. ACA25]